MELIEIRLPPAVARPRFRFGLKALFLFTTLLCVWLGYKYERVRRANELIARHQAVLEVIVRRIATPPEGTFYVFGRESADQLLYKLSFPGEHFRRQTILDVGHSASSMTQDEIIDVSKLLATKKPNDVVVQLAHYYGADLASVGLQLTTSGYRGNHGDLSVSRDVWNSPNNDLVVVIDAEIDPKSQRAFVSVMLIDGQQLHLW